MSFLNDIKNKNNNADRDFYHENENVKEVISDLASDVRRVSSDSVQAVTDYMSDRIHDITSSGKKTLAKAEVRIKEKPGQSIAIAFAAGIFASYFLGRRAA
jgi:ElaB/YqjD/DUF883 family membrane-anchored ribosome-binding protein